MCCCSYKIYLMDASYMCIHVCVTVISSCLVCVFSVLAVVSMRPGILHCPK